MNESGITTPIYPSLSPNIIKLEDKDLESIFRMIQRCLENGDKKGYNKCKSILDDHAKKEYSVE